MTRFLKGLMAGVISVVVGAVVIAFGGMLVLAMIEPRSRGHATVMQFLQSAKNTPLIWFAGGALFLIGFVGEMRRN